ncbi:transcription factor 7-like 1, partial [Hippocampus zosterae]|uniref:transcription factor 7-like 1 n=1 Tax=Hippocampus zosterae TaxID=109293 RepID=UPI00223DDB39
MEQFQTLSTDEDVKWDKLLDNIMKTADAILYGTSSANIPLPQPLPPPPSPPSPKEETRPLAIATAASEHRGATDLLPLASGQDHMELLMEGQPLDVDDELSNVLDDFWLPDYLGGQPGSINVQDLDDNIAVMPAHDGMNQPLLGRLNGELMCGASSSSDIIEPPTEASQTICSSSKSQCYGQQEANRPYIKKPPNAFMLFRKEQSPNVVAQFNITNSAAVNKILGRMWKSLPKKLQAKYYQQAEEHKILHSLQHPDWSCTENYGKKRKRDRSRHSTSGPSKSYLAAAAMTSRHTHTNVS